MEQACSTIECEMIALYSCSCSGSDQYMCHQHLQSHHLLPGPHKIAALFPQTSSISSFQVLSSEEDHKPTSFISIPPNLYALSIHVEKTHLPNEIIKVLESITKLFIEEIMKLHRLKDDRLSSECCDFLSTVSRVIINFDFNSNEFTSQIVNFFLEMQSRLENFFSDLVRKAIPDLNNKCQMPNSINSYYIYSKNLNAVNERFLEYALSLKTYDLDSLIEKFDEVYKGFFSRSDIAENHFQDLITEYERFEKDCKDVFAGEIMGYISNLYSNKEYLWVILNSCKLTDEIETTLAEVPIYWKCAMAIIAEEDDFHIEQCVEIKKKLCVVISANTSEKSFIYVLENNKPCLAMISMSKSVMIASGSTDNQVIIVEKYPKRFIKCVLHRSLLHITDEIDVEMETYYSLVSAAFIFSTDCLILVTDEGKAFTKVKDDYLTPFTPFQNSEDEVIKSVQYSPQSNILAVQSMSSIALLNGNLELLHIIQQECTNLIILNQNDEIFLLWHVAEIFSYCKLFLSASEIILSSTQKIPTQNFIFSSASEFINKSKIFLKNLTVTTHYEKFTDNDFTAFYKRSGVLANSLKKNSRSRLSRNSLEESKELSRYSKILDSPKRKYIACKQNCELCESMCINEGVHDVHLCRSSHRCKKMCGELGNCGEKGKKCCIIEILPGETEHEGEHRCESQGHYCEIKCPCCGGNCGESYGHEGQHSKKKHKKIYFTKRCGEICSGSQHTHQLQCFGPDNCGGILYPSLCVHSENCDLWECPAFWNVVNWVKPE